MTENEKKVKEILEEVLALEDSGETITADSNLINDLAAESIDFIDICFRLEKDFNIGKVAVTDIFPAVLKDEEKYDEDNMKNELKKYPHINGDLLEEIISTKSLKPLMKVKTLINFVDWKKANA